MALFKGATANSHAGFEAFNEALKRRVETTVSKGDDAGHGPRAVEGA